MSHIVKFDTRSICRRGRAGMTEEKGRKGEREGKRGGEQEEQENKKGG